ncbi:MAG: pilin [Desulfobulbaceae bacterium]|nr:pilin [Desulfobulbaceae bacterium]
MKKQVMEHGIMRDNRGFTLIELMVVISIMMILTTMALPSFQERIIRNQVKEAFNLAEVAKTGIEEYYNSTGRMPHSNQEAGLPVSEKMIGNYVTTVLVKDGVINITLGNKINKNVTGEIISIRPAIVEDAAKVPIAWIYAYSSVPKGMTVIGENGTSVLPRLLPIFCRI